MKRCKQCGAWIEEEIRKWFDSKAFEAGFCGISCLEVYQAIMEADKRHAKNS